MSRRATEAPPADRHQRRLFRAVVAESFVNRLGFGIVTFALPLYALELGMGITEIGVLVAAKALLQPAVKPFVGMAIDRWGTRTAYLGAVSFRLLASVVLLLAATPAALYGVRLLQGMASAAQDPVSITALAKGPTNRVGRRFSALYAARDIAKVAAGLVAGLLLAATGSFTTVWALVTALAVIPLALVWFFVREIPELPPSSPALEPPPTPEQAGRILKSPGLRTIAALGLFGGLTANMTHAMFQVYAATVAGLSNAEIGLIYSLSVAALLLVGPLAGWLGDRRGHGILASARGVANAASSVVYLLLPSFGGMLAGRLVDDAGKAAFRPTWGALIARASTGAGRRGGRTAANLDAWLSVGEALGPLVAAVLWDTAGFVSFLVTRAVLGVVVELILGRRLRRLLRAGSDEPAVPDLSPGPGQLTLRDLLVIGETERLDLTVEPGGVRDIEVGSAEAADRLLGELSSGRPISGQILVDGQDLAQHARPPRQQPVGVLTSLPAARESTVGDLLRLQCPDPAPEDLVHAWRRSGLAAHLPLDQALRLPARDLDPGLRDRLPLACALVGNPAVLVIDGRFTESAGVEPAVRALIRGHPGAVLTLQVKTDRGHEGHSRPAASGREGSAGIGLAVESQ